MTLYLNVSRDLQNIEVSNACALFDLTNLTTVNNITNKYLLDLTIDVNGFLSADLTEWANIQLNKIRLDLYDFDYSHEEDLLSLAEQIVFGDEDFVSELVKALDGEIEISQLEELRDMQRDFVNDFMSDKF